MRSTLMVVSLMLRETAALLALIGRELRGPSSVAWGRSYERWLGALLYKYIFLASLRLR